MKIIKRRKDGIKQTYHIDSKKYEGYILQAIKKSFPWWESLTQEKREDLILGEYIHYGLKVPIHRIGAFIQRMIDHPKEGELMWNAAWAWWNSLALKQRNDIIGKLYATHLATGKK